MAIPREPAAAERRGGPAGFLSREHVLEATAACFDELGYDGTTIRAIAARLGCAVGSIYRYCRDKRELLAACAALMLEPVVEAMGTTDRTFDRSVQRYAAVAARHSELYRLMFWIGDGNGGLPLVVKRIIGGWTRMLGDVTEARQRWALLHGLLMLGADPRKVVETVLGHSYEAPQGSPHQPPAAPVSEPATSPRGRDDITLL